MFIQYGILIAAYYDTESQDIFVLRLILGILYHLFMALFINAQIKLSETYNIKIRWLALPMYIILSPIAPILIYYLRRYYYDSKLRSILTKYEIINARPSYNAEYEKHEDLNLYRWINIQWWRHLPFLYCTIFASIQVSLSLKLVIQNPSISVVVQSLSVLSVILTIISIFLRAMVYHTEYRYTTFIQSFWINVLMTGIHNEISIYGYLLVI